MQAILARIQNISGSVLALSLFAGAFLLGLAIFALSQSLVIAAATMGLVSLSGALATREWLSKRDAAQTQDAIHSEFRQQARRVNALSDRIIELENELRVARPNHRHVDRIQLERLSKEFESVITIVGQLVKIVDAQESRFIKYDARFAKTISANPKHSETRLSPQPAATPSAATLPARNGFAPLSPPDLPSSRPPVSQHANALPKPHHPLAALQTEGILREDIMSGKLKVRLFDLVQMVSGRVAMREMRCALEGRLPTLQTDADLIAQEISAGVVQLFDRVRFGYAFEIAGQLSAQPSAIPILCPIMNATFRDVTCAEEIVTLIEAQSDIAERLILSFDQTLIMSLRDEERLRIQRLNAAGTRLAMRISTDFAFDPEEITVLGFGFLVASAADLIDDRTEMMQSAIHAADLASYFERYGLMLIANDVDDPAQLIRLKALGIACAGGPVTMRPASTRPTVAARPEERKVTAQAALADKPPASPTSAPLRDRLRRVQA